jgi:hypothetical protein
VVLMKQISVGQSVVNGRLRWYRSLISSDRKCIEEDGTGFPPPELREEILKTEGEWEILMTTGDPKRVALILREVLAITAKEALENAKSGVLYRGTKTEAQWLSQKLSPSHAQVSVQPTKTK